jgi:hypothetical protein
MRQPRDEEDDDLEDDWENPDPSDMDQDDEPEQIPCPYCNRMILEETDICPYCGSFISREDVQTKPPHWKISIVLTLIAATAGVLGVLMRWFM